MDKITRAVLQDTHGKISYYEMKALDTVVTSLDPSTSLLGSLPVDNLVNTDDPVDFKLQSLDAMPTPAKVVAASFPTNALLDGSDYAGEVLVDRIGTILQSSATFGLWSSASQQRVLHAKVGQHSSQMLQQAGLPRT